MDRTVTFEQEETSGHKPQPGLDTKTDRMTDRQSQCDFDLTLRVIGGDERGSFKSETVKYGRESQGTRTRKRLRWQGPAAIINDRPVLSSERASQMNTPATVRQ
jgi:hypothetical protein